MRTHRYRSISQKSWQVINRQPDDSELDSNTGKHNFKGLSRPNGTKQVFKSVHINLGSFSLKNVSLTLIYTESLWGMGVILNAQSLDFSPRDSHSLSIEWTQESVLLTAVQAVLVLLERRCSRCQ